MDQKKKYLKYKSKYLFDTAYKFTNFHRELLEKIKANYNV